MSETLRQISRKSITVTGSHINTAENIQIGSLQRIADALEHTKQPNSDFSEVIKAVYKIQGKYDRKIAALEKKYSLLKERLTALQAK